MTTSPSTDRELVLTRLIDAPRDMPDARLAVGSNSASQWWLNGLVIQYPDRCCA